MKIIIAAVIIIASAAAAAGIFFLLRKIMYSIIDRRIERFQSDIIEKQVREIQNMYRQIRGWRHDYRNHIQNMKIQLAEGNYDKLSVYLCELADDLDTVDKAGIPDQLPMSDVELCSVLGNMLDNAVEACGALPENERFIRVYIGQLKKQFYISVQNSAGRVRREKGMYLSTKEGEHGYGLFRIDRIVGKYGGYVNRQNEEGVFATEIMIPLSAKTS